ncbi:MAG: sugar phosphate isomerase/epimerase [Acidobacteria bacterium]|nr:sugar phosphate isomerase/epimerase [Acidobacteriota bacterium]
MASRIPMGLNTYCLRALRWNDARLLDYCGQLKLDAVFLQDSLDPKAMDPAHWREVREHAARLGLHLETGGGGVFPKTPDAIQASVDGILKNVARAKAMGSPIVRCVIASDRASLPPGPIEQHIATMVRLLKAVRSQVMDAGLKIAIEIHKDLQAWEHRALIEEAGPEFVGTYLDTGNPVFVMEDPLTTIEVLGRYALTVHLRDSVVYEVPRGIAVQWVPLGEGSIDFRQVIAKVREHCPPVYVYIKPITGRPPQILPLYDAEHWKPFPKARAADLARFLALAKRGQPYGKNMVVEDLQGRATPPYFLEAIQHQQREHMERSIAYARKVLDLGVKSA